MGCQSFHNPEAIFNAIIIVDHNLDLVLALSDRTYALERGRVVHQGPSRPLLEDLEYRREVLWL